MKRTILVVACLITVLLFSVTNHIAEGASDQESIKMFTGVGWQNNPEIASKQVEQKVNEWLEANKNIQIVQRSMSACTYMAAVHVVISIHYLKK